jgi:hypothetical protein
VDELCTEIESILLADSMGLLFQKVKKLTSFTLFTVRCPQFSLANFSGGTVDVFANSLSAFSSLVFFLHTKLPNLSLLLLTSNQVSISSSHSCCLFSEIIVIFIVLKAYQSNMATLGKSDAGAIFGTKFNPTVDNVTPSISNIFQWA